MATTLLGLIFRLGARLLPKDQAHPPRSHRLPAHTLDTPPLLEVIKVIKGEEWREAGRGLGRGSLRIRPVSNGHQ